VMRTVDAETEPVELVEPMAVMQSPTARSDDAALCVSVNLVDDVIFTVVWVAAAVVEGVEPGRKPDEENPLTTIELVVIDTTLPVTNPKFAAPAGGPPEPPGIEPPDPPRGNVPPFGIDPEDRAPPPGNPPVVQEPDELGVLIVTVWAVTVPLLDDPTTVTQSPEVTEAATTVAVFVNLVAGVQLTVT
jgi:hypothetical protein